MTHADNPFLSGNFAPVEAELTAFDLPVEGQIPKALNGRFIRNGPNPLGDIDPATHHWFTGNGMVHGLKLEDGQARWYRNRYVRSPAICALLGETPIENPFGDPARIFAANTNVIGHAGRTFALVEAGGCPVELSYELDTIAYSDFGGTLERAFSAHPKRDPLTGELHTVAYCWGWGNQVQYVCVDAMGQVSRSVNVPTTGGPMVHDTAFTERFVLILDLPCVFDVNAARRGVSLPYRWQPEYPARIGLLPRDGAETGSSDVIWADIEPCYIFHPLNAYDDEQGRVVFDAVRHPRMFAGEHVIGPPNEGTSTLDRWTIDPVSRRVSHDVISERAQEFPRHDERREGRFSRFGYSTDLWPVDNQMALLKTDLRTGGVAVHSCPGRHHLEGVFIPREGNANEDQADENQAGEDDGWVMAYAWDAASSTSVVVIIDAADFKAPPVATVRLPQRVPFGFHGNWVSG
ncbi:MAG: carotenoid oxygenase [Gammaproteobacteria bacterium]|nr:carotenoid oxygenase [Gammaproteobacteria bacterium]